MILELILGACASLTGGMLLAVFTGKLVPSSQVDAQEKETEKWKASYQELLRSSNKQEKLLERLVLTADVTDKVLNQVRSELE